MEITSSVLGFLASVMLFVPGWRTSRYLRLIYQVKETAKEAEMKGEELDPGETLAAKLQAQSSSWNRRDHFMLIAGFALLCASFLVALLAKLCAIT